MGDKDSDSLCLYCTQKGELGRYIALSHCWGKPDESQSCTFGCNLDSRRKSIDFGNLPKTFQHAITVARELGVRFLWIDSLCIIQSHKKPNECLDKYPGECHKRSDWNTESTKMETVFSSAYCTIAASSAQNSTEGFLNRRQCVKVPNASDTPLYVCNTNDFRRDVEKGVLSQRGWVLQERALSRRTIHFTEKQTYWECSKGVHCESLIKMHK